MIVFSQRDKKWADVIYSSKPPHTETIKSSGCGITVAAMIISNLTNFSVEPPEMAEFSVKNGFRIDGVGTSHSLYPAIAKKYNLKCTQSYDIYKAAECVQSGGLVVCSTNGGENKLFSTGGHLFIMSGIYGNDLEFVDPDNYPGKYQTAYRKQRCYENDGKIYVNINEAKNHISVYYCFLPNSLLNDSNTTTHSSQSLLLNQKVLSQMTDEVENITERTDKMNKYSYDNTVEHLIRLGITNKENMQYWEKTLSGEEPLNKDNVRTIFDRLIAKVYE